MNDKTSKTHAHVGCDHKHTHGPFGHAHGHNLENRSVRNIGLALSLNMSFALVELFGGYWTQSTAIQADAIHDLGDSAALGAALLLQVVAAIPARAGFSFGLRRFSLLSAVMTSLLLVGGSIYVTLTAFERFHNPVTPHLNGMLALALLGVLVNGFAAWRMSRGLSRNEQALAWHMMEDLFGWVAVLISSFLMRFWDIPWIDPLLAIVIGVIVLVGAMRSLWLSVRLFLQAVPADISEHKVKERILQIPGIKAISGLQIWSLDGHNHVGSIQVQVEALDVKTWASTRQKVATAMQEFGSFELTIEPLFESQFTRDNQSS